jgi:hypothetical protein
MWFQALTAPAAVNGQPSPVAKAPPIRGFIVEGLRPLRQGATRSHPYQGIISSGLRQGDWRFFGGQQKLLDEADGIKSATFAGYTTKYLLILVYPSISQW